MEKDGKIYNNELVCNWINKYEVYVRSVLDMETVSLGSKTISIDTRASLDPIYQVDLSSIILVINNVPDC